MDDEANRCWCGSTLKGKPHNCIGTQGRIEGLLSENLNLREAIRGEREKNGVLSIWLKEEGDKVKALELQISVIRNYVNEEGVSDTAKVIRVQGVVNKTEKRVEPSQKCKCVWYPSMVTPYKDPDCQNPMHS